MKKLFVALMLVAFAATTTFAADVVTYPAKNGTVTFNHKAHQAKNECKACHEGAPAKIEINKDKAHAMCKGCHEKSNGPTKCGDCHKK
jgi:type 1 fimbria pilin